MNDDDPDHTLDHVLSFSERGEGFRREGRFLMQSNGFRQVSRQLAVGRGIEVEEPLRSGEVKDPMPALLFGQDDGALGPDDAWLPTLPVPGLRAGLQ